MDESYIMQKIDQILENSKYLEIALQQLENLDEASAMAVGHMIEQREQTNRCMIELLTKMMQRETGIQIKTNH